MPPNGMNAAGRVQVPADFAHAESPVLFDRVLLSSLREGEGVVPPEQQLLWAVVDGADSQPIAVPFQRERLCSEVDFSVLFGTLGDIRIASTVFGIARRGHRFIVLPGTQK